MRLLLRCPCHKQKGLKLSSAGLFHEGAHVPNSAERSCRKATHQVSRCSAISPSAFVRYSVVPVYGLNFSLIGLRSVASKRHLKRSVWGSSTCDDAVLAAKDSYTHVLGHVY